MGLTGVLGMIDTILYFLTSDEEGQVYILVGVLDALLVVIVFFAVVWTFWRGPRGRNRSEVRTQVRLHSDDGPKQENKPVESEHTQLRAEPSPTRSNLLPALRLARVRRRFVLRIPSYMRLDSDSGIGLTVGWGQLATQAGRRGAYFLQWW
jgi:hypothetical protein